MNFYDIKEIHCPVDMFMINLSKKILPLLSFFNESDIYCISLLFTFLSGYTINNKIKILPGVFFFFKLFI